MPFKARRPAGGFKVMYEYANRLSERGYSVKIIYPLHTKYMKYRWPYLIRLFLSYIEGFSTNEWFPFKKEITRLYVKSVKDKYIPDSDLIIATWWSTAWDMGYLSPEKGVKVNLIQGYENWEGHEELLHMSYDMKKTTNIVVASYLKDIVRKYTNNPIFLIPNSIDDEKYYISNPIEKRKPFSICMMYSVQEIKGTEFGIKALNEVKLLYPDLKVDLFGVCPDPGNLPDWMIYHRNPDNITELYNNNSIFISNSLTEGMALTPMEAMFCGCSCVLTDIRGHSEYAIANETCVLYEVRNTQQLVNVLSDLFSDNDKRIRIASGGNAFIHRFSWDNAVEKMDKLIKKLVNEDRVNN